MVIENQSIFINQIILIVDKYDTPDCQNILTVIIISKSYHQTILTIQNKH
jgi:hypothetical protein